MVRSDIVEHPAKPTTLPRRGESIAVSQRDHAAAQRLIEERLALYRDLDDDRYVLVAKTGIHRGSWDAAWVAGRGMTLDAVLAYALIDTSCRPSQNATTLLTNETRII